MTRSVEEQMADIERRMKQLRARKQRIVARENAKARKRRTHLIIRLGGILSNEGVLGYDEGVWNDEGNREIRRSNGELVDVLPPSEAEDYSVTVSRGCADSNAGCWAGGNALGDMQFAGTGTATGSWPYRNSYTTGNKSGQITFAINGVTYTPVAAGPWMRIATADGSGVDGVSVTRW